MKKFGFFTFAIGVISIIIGLIILMNIKTEYDSVRLFPNAVVSMSIGCFLTLIGSIFAGCGAIVEEIRGGKSSLTNNQQINNQSIESEFFDIGKWSASNFVIRGSDGLKFDEEAVTKFVEEMKKSKPAYSGAQLIAFYKMDINAITNGFPESLRSKFTEDFENKVNH